MKMMMMAITMKMKRTMMGVKMTTIEVVVPGAMKMMRKEAVKAKKKEKAT